MPTVVGVTWRFFLLNPSQTVYSAHTCTMYHYIITVISFTYQKMDKGTSQQVTAFVKRT